MELNEVLAENVARVAELEAENEKLIWGIKEMIRTLEGKAEFLKNVLNAKAIGGD